MQILKKHAEYSMSPELPAVVMELERFILNQLHMLRFVTSTVNLLLLSALIVHLTAQDNRQSLTSKVELHIDSWGVPHIEGESNAATVFGYGYYRASEEFELLEEKFIQAIGRWSEVVGAEATYSMEGRMGSDLVVHAFD